MSHQCDLFIFTAEASADMHAAELLHLLKQKNPSLRIHGVAGPKMRESRLIEPFLKMEAFAVMGFSAVLTQLPRLARQFYAVRKKILALNPKAVLFFDAPAFSLRMANHLKAQGFTGKILQYVCPSVWAWGKRRIPQMEKNLDLIFSILPFEKEFLKESSLKIEYIGHPLAATYMPKSIEDNPPQLLALFPGSRRKELELNLLAQLEAAKIVQKTFPQLKIYLSIANPAFRPWMEKKAQAFSPIHFFENAQKAEVMEKADLAIAKCGTIILELALKGVPTVVSYGLTPFDLYLAKYLFRIRRDFYSLPNILLKESLFPEWIGPYCTKENIAESGMQWLSSLDLRKILQEKSKRLYDLLQKEDGKELAAQKIFECL